MGFGLLGGGREEDDDCAHLAKDGDNTVGWYVTGEARPQPH
jgi:hypothetical protein